MLPDVLKLDPVPVSRPWGGRRLAEYGRALPEGWAVGESWEVADLPDGVAAGVDDPRSRVIGGPLDGSSLTDLIHRYGSDLLGSAQPTSEGRFPLLVKLLDAREHLSVQVHPDADYVALHPGTRLKTESWYVVGTRPGARIFLDFDTRVPSREVEAALGTEDLVPLLQSIPAEPGAFHHIPAGRVHALGAGCLVLEVQTPSDTTFRMYDWRVEYGREPRPLHLEESRETIVRHDPSAISLAAATSPGTRELVGTPHYWMREHRSSGGTLPLDPKAELRVVTVAAGTVTVADTRVPTLSTVVIPAASPALGAMRAEPDSVVVEVGLV